MYDRRLIRSHRDLLCTVRAFMLGERHSLALRPADVGSTHARHGAVLVMIFTLCPTGRGTSDGITQFANELMSDMTMPSDFSVGPPLPLAVTEKVDHGFS